MATTIDDPRVIRAPRGTEISCLGWQQEAALRMLMNNLDPEVAERPEQLIVYGGIGKAARNWECSDDIVATLRRLKNDETLLVQSGKPVGVFRTHEYAPRVLIANANLVPHWGRWEEFRRLEALGLTMYGQMTAGSWIYIGTQGILQGTYECFAALAKQRFNDSLRGKLVVTAGLGGMGGAQPLAATMNEATALIAEVDRTRIQRRLDKRYLDEEAPSLDAAIKRALEARDRGEAVSIGVVANAVDLLEALIARNITPDILTDQTSAHDELHGYVPAGLSYDASLAIRESSPEMYVERSFETMARHIRAMLELQRRGSVASPNRETEGMRDGSDAIADWPILNALLNTACGATWVSVHHGGGVGIGYSLHAGMVVVADGTEDAASRLERVLTADPGTGVMRHADAGYERAIEVAKERGVDLPMV